MKLPRTPNKGWGFVIIQVKFFHLFDQRIERKNYKSSNDDLGPFRRQEWSLLLIEWEPNP